MGVNVSPIRIHRVEYRDIGRERLDSDKKLRCHRMMTPETIDIVVNNGVLITMDKRRRILLDGALAIHNGRIVAIGNSTDVSRTYRPDRTIDANGGVVHPGFIDCHVHLSLHLGRGSIPDSWPVEREHEQWLPYWTGLTEHEAYCAATLGCMEMVRNGTTTCCDQSGRYPVQLTAKHRNEGDLDRVLLGLPSRSRGCNGRRFRMRQATRAIVKVAAAFWGQIYLGCGWPSGNGHVQRPTHCRWQTLSR